MINEICKWLIVVIVFVLALRVYVKTDSFTDFSLDYVIDAQDGPSLCQDTNQKVNQVQSCKFCLDWYHTCRDVLSKSVLYVEKKWLEMYLNNCSYDSLYDEKSGKNGKMAFDLSSNLWEVERKRNDHFSATSPYSHVVGAIEMKIDVDKCDEQFKDCAQSCKKVQ